KLIYTVKKLF
ncbi:hypothetical protein FOXB_15672, partial [Fusarium oxysporum f. sp. conglutinans Fo5176]